MRRRCLLVALVFTAPLAAQSRSERLVTFARDRMAAGEWEAADTALASALGSALYPMDSVNAMVWRGVYEYLQGDEARARASFRRALELRVISKIDGLEKISPGLAVAFEDEARPYRVYRPSELDEPAVWHTGPAFVYPAELRRRRLAGHALIRAIVDTTGRVEERGFLVLESPDPAFNAPLRDMIYAAQFTPGRVKGHAVRSQINLGFSLSPPPPENPTTLITAAREQLRARHLDSAIALTDLALDSGNNPSDGERVYAHLVQGIAWHRKGRDSLATISFDAGLAGYRDLTSRGVDLAPFLKRLADSIRVSRRGARPPAVSPFAAPSVVGSVDEQPALISHPPIRYAPEMQALRIGGTVLVEATLDTTGHVIASTARVVQSPNPIFDAEAKRVTIAAVYRPARIGGRPARVTIRQPITFAAY